MAQCVQFVRASRHFYLPETRQSHIYCLAVRRGFSHAQTLAMIEAASVVQRLIGIDKTSSTV